MSAPELFGTMGEKFQEFLNCGLFTTDSLEGWLCIFILGYFLWKLWQRAADFVGWCAMMILLLQIGYFLSKTSLNDIIPLDILFRTDVLGSIAGLVKHEGIHNGLVWLNEHIELYFQTGWELIASGEFLRILKQAVLFE